MTTITLEQALDRGILTYREPRALPRRAGGVYNRLALAAPLTEDEVRAIERRGLEEHKARLEDEAYHQVRTLYLAIRAWLNIRDGHLPFAPVAIPAATKDGPAPIPAWQEPLPTLAPRARLVLGDEWGLACRVRISRNRKTWVSRTINGPVYRIRLPRNRRPHTLAYFRDDLTGATLDPGTKTWRYPAQPAAHVGYARNERDIAAIRAALDTGFVLRYTSPEGQATGWVPPVFDRKRGLTYDPAHLRLQGGTLTYVPAEAAEGQEGLIEKQFAEATQEFEADGKVYGYSDAGELRGVEVQPQYRGRDGNVQYNEEALARDPRYADAAHNSQGCACGLSPAKCQCGDPLYEQPGEVEYAGFQDDLDHRERQALRFRQARDRYSRASRALAALERDIDTLAEAAIRAELAQLNRRWGANKRFLHTAKNATVRKNTEARLVKIVKRERYLANVLEGRDGWLWGRLSCDTQRAIEEMEDLVADGGIRFNSPIAKAVAFQMAPVA